MADSAASLFLAHSTGKLDQMTSYLRSCLGQLNEQQVWERHAAHENTIGNLVLHLSGNMRQWILHGVGGQPDVRIRELEFSQHGVMTSQQLYEHFLMTIQESKLVIASLPHERLTERTTPQGRDVSVLDAIYQVVGHVQQHVGQIILLTKQMTGKDLDLTIARPR